MKNIDVARPFLHDFYVKTPELYGERFSTLNVHNIDHVADDVENSCCDFNVLSAFPFKNHLGAVKRSITNPHRVLAQYCRRLHTEMEIINHVPKIPEDVQILAESQKNSSITKLFYKNQTFTSKHPNNTALLKNGSIVSIQRIHKKHDVICATVKCYKILGSAFYANSPGSNPIFDSKDLNYVEIRDDNRSSEYIIPFEIVRKKMVKFSVNYSENSPIKTFVVPLNH